MIYQYFMKEASRQVPNNLLIMSYEGTVGRYEVGDIDQDAIKTEQR